MLSFMGIGAQKCGTTWLYHWLSRHPLVAFPLGKEVHFWDRRDTRSIESYLGAFSGDRVEGDITPAYGFQPPETIAEVRALLPALRLVYLYRNPIERAWSHARMDLRVAGGTVGSTPDSWFIGHFNGTDSLLRGDYLTCIRNWRDAYDGQLLVLPTEDLSRDARTALTRCCNHIGISAEAYAAISDDELAAPIFRGDDVPLRPSLYPVLHALYCEKISRLSDYLGADLSGWLQA
ncbi:MAG: sulfotransferase [Devosia sp.]|nr:sulfotransferase [Devosia sp.]